MANYEELKSVFVNRFIIRGDSVLGNGYTSSTLASETQLYMVELYNGQIRIVNKYEYQNQSGELYRAYLCVK